MNSNEAIRQPLLDKFHEKSHLEEAHLLGRLFFTWLNPLLGLGYKQKLLQRSDIPTLPDTDKARTSYSKFLHKWESQEHPSIAWTLAQCHSKEAAVTGFYALVKTIIISLNPLLLQYFIDFSAGICYFPNEGYVLVAVLFVSKLIENLSQRHWLFGARRIGIRIRSSLISAIYEKELRLSHDARQRHSAGEITGYISVDTFRLGEFPWWFHQMYTYPLQIFIALCILVHTVGWATLPGLVIIVGTAVLQAPLAKSQQKSQYNFMMAQDDRLRTTSSVLSNMKIVKLQAWEGMFKRAIGRSRGEEFKWLSSLKKIWALGSLMYWMSPIITASVVFAACIPLGITLDAAVIFTVLATFRVIQEPVRNVPEVLTAVIQAGVSLQRLSEFFNERELQPGAVDWKFSMDPDDEFAISIENCSWTWEHLDKPTVQNINLKVGRAETVGICGKVGSGKSTLLYSILGETQKVSGQVRLRGSIAYVAQTAWIQSGTVRDNITFGLPFEESLYQRTLTACALVEDLSSFSYGDMTEIGERGLNLSGGQKQRVQLARALYADAEIYLLDDPFSAVDAHTASLLFKSYILEALSGKTVVLVTHQVEFLSAVDSIVVMDGGAIVEDGGISFEQLVNAHNLSGNDSRTKQGDSEMLKVFQQAPVTKQMIGQQTDNQLTREEERGTGDMGLKPFINYITTSRSHYLLVGVVITQTLFVLGTSSSNYWLAAQVSNPDISMSMLIGVFAGISFISTVIIYGRSRIVVAIGLRASQTFFSGLMESLFQAPMSLFDSTPLGRILTRLSSDMSLLDVDIPTCLGFVSAGTFDLIGTLVVIAIVTWKILFVAIPMLLVLKFVQGYYLYTARELIRINGTTKAPLLNKTAETINGAVTIRAFRKMEEFKDANMHLVDSDAAVSLHIHAAYEWLTMRVEFVGTCILSSAALFMVLIKDKIPPGFAGLSLSYALSLNSIQIFLVQWLSNTASYIVSVERISQYLHLPKEALHIIQGSRPPVAWPDKGRVELQNLEVRYRENSPLVLKGISCVFPEGKRIGLVGRTGSGKTTLISALFRLVEPSGGKIIIDNIDITSIGLHDLRSRLGVIPQEAFLFRGTIRSNLDPAEQYSDPEIWQALQKCQLHKEIEKQSTGLDTVVADEGENWSAGQKQLFCLARVLLKRCKVLVLDEATASIDSTTDSILQKVIRDEFVSCTVITVAHRIPTVMDSDMVLGLSHGQAMEYGPPTDLLSDRTSLFAKLVTEYWSSGRS